jgi:hypothetical protein
MTVFKQHRKARVVIALRRRQVAELLQNNNNITETEIAQQLKVDKSVISRDITALKQDAMQFIYDLAKKDLAYFYHNTFQSLRQVKAKALSIYDSNQSKPVIQLKALDTVIKCDLASFDILQQGPTVMSVKGLNDRIEKLELSQQQDQQQEKQEEGELTA